MISWFLDKKSGRRQTDYFRKCAQEVDQNRVLCWAKTPTSFTSFPIVLTAVRICSKCVSPWRMPKCCGRTGVAHKWTGKSRVVDSLVIWVAAFDLDIVHWVTGFRKHSKPNWPLLVLSIAEVSVTSFSGPQFGFTQQHSDRCSYTASKYECRKHEICKYFSGLNIIMFLL